MAVTPPTAPTAPKAPSVPSIDTANAVPESHVESSGPSVPAGELETPASKFGIHIRLGGSEAVEPQFTENDNTGQQEKTQAKQENGKKIEQTKQTADKPKSSTTKQEKHDEQEITGQQVMQYISGEEKETKQTESSLKVMPQDDSIFAGFSNSHTTYWPFLLVFSVAFVCFLAMNFMKKRENNDFGSLSYKKSSLTSVHKDELPKVPAAVQKAYTENKAVKLASKPVNRNILSQKEPPKKFEVRI